MSKLSKLIIALGLFSLIGLTNSGFAQDVDPELYKNMKWRDLGFSRGGRSTTSAGIAEDHLT